MGRSYSPRVQCLNFNEAQDCFICGLDSGVRLYNTDPLVEKLNLSGSLVGSVSYCCMLQRTNLLAIVGGEPCPKFSENSAVLYDACREDFVLEISCPAPVIAVKMTALRLAVVLLRQIHLFSLVDRPVKLATFETPDNGKGLCEFAANPLRELIVFPGHKIGSVQVVDLKMVSLGSSSAPNTISAHQNSIASFTVNQQGTLLATASVKGTLIRLFDLDKRSLLAELRRGSDPATVYCLRFSPDSSYLCCCSDKATVHIFAVKDQSLNRRSTLQKVGIPSTYMESQWDLAKFSLPTDCPSICGFTSNNQSVIALCQNGDYNKFTFNQESAKCTREGFDHFLEIGNDADFWDSYKIT